MKVGSVLVLAACFLLPTDVCGEWVRGEGTWLFGPDVAEREACQRAERKAREAAIRKITGEKLTSEDMLVCKEQQDDAACHLNRYTWSTIDGEIRGIRNKSQETGQGAGGARECRVVLEADVGVASGRPDPSFDMTVRLNRKTFRHGESLEVRIAPTQPMYVSVFQWLPYEKSPKQVSRIFPNPFDRENLFQTAGTVPTEKGRRAYEMAIGFPEALMAKKNLVDEYLMVVATRTPIKFRKIYALDEFKTRLLEIPREDWRQVRKAYNIVRPE